MTKRLDTRMNRREFLGQASCAGIGSVSILSTLFNLTMANRLAAADLGSGVPNPVAGNDRRSLVCIFLAGGHDSFNALVPRGSAEYADYAAARTNLAIADTDLLPLTLAPALGGAATEDRQDFGLHPSLAAVADMFNGTGAFAGQRRLSFVSNVGTLVEPTTKSQYLAEAVSLPKALFSHADQIEQWQTAIPQGSTELSGWAGRAADVMHSSVNIHETSLQVATIPMNLSLSGRSALQTGRCSEQFVITPSGGLQFTRNASDDDPGRVLYEKNRALTNLMSRTYGNLIQQAFADTTRSSVEKQGVFQQVFDNPGASIEAALDSVAWPSTSFASSLRAVARTIAVRDQFNLRRQTAFVQFGGWDHHGELLQTHAGMLTILGQGLAAFQQALEALGVQDDVITFTASDFGRTLRSNGQGTDHAWAGNQMVFGGGIEGGHVFGRFPSLVLDSPDDVGRGGRMLPSTPIDGYVAEMLQWFGVSRQNLPYVLPNVENFYDLASMFDATSPTPPLGFVA